MPDAKENADKPKGLDDFAQGRELPAMAGMRGMSGAGHAARKRNEMLTRGKPADPAWSAFEELGEALSWQEAGRARAALARGAPASGCDARGATPLMAAVMGGSAECVELLLDAGADPWARDAKGESALDLALTEGLPECAAAISARMAALWEREALSSELEAGAPRRGVPRRV